MKRNLFLLWVLGCLFNACSEGNEDAPAQPIEPDKPEQEEPEKPDPDTPDALTATFPDDFTPEWVQSVAGKVVTLSNPLFVTETYGGSAPKGSVVLSSEVKRVFTEVNRPSTIAYPTWVEKHQTDRLTLSSEFPLVDADRTLRVGTELTQLKGTVSYAKGRYTLTLTEAPQCRHQSRTLAPTVKDYNLKVMSFNAEHYYLYGKTEQPERQRQHAKILAALKEAQADVYALCEIEQGDFTVNYLCEYLNRAVGEERYAWLTTPGQPSKQTQVCAFLYDQTRVQPYLDFHSYDFDNLRMRFVAQCFELQENGARVILTMNHLKAKDSKNDLKDGQGGSSARRLKEARFCLKTYRELTETCGDEDVLILGDLNSYSMEDPIQEFLAAGYTNQLKKHAPDRWSYVYRGEVGYLDHSLSSATLSSQVVGASPWDINASEPAYFGFEVPDFFQADPYRSSDHNPILTWLNLK